MTAPTPPADTEKVTVTSNCHCGAVALEARILPLDQATIFDCNCTNCRWHGFNATHCPRRDIIFLRGEELLSAPYVYNAKSRGFKFCTRCGVGMIFDVLDDRKQEMGWEEEYVAINARTFKGVNLENDVKLKFYDGLTEIPKQSQP